MKRFSLDEYLKNPSRRVVTRDGGNVRIVCTDVKSEIYPVLALVDNGNEEVPTPYTKYGEFISKYEYSCDLFFAPEKHESWINVYRNAVSRIYDSEEQAKSCKGNKALATIKIEWEE